MDTVKNSHFFLFLLGWLGMLLLTSQMDSRSGECAKNIELATSASTIDLAKEQMKVVLNTCDRDKEENNWDFWYKNLIAQNQLLYTKETSSMTSQATVLQSFRDNLERENSWR
jgi:hypothetical protein